MGDCPLIMDRVRDHAIFALVVEQDAQLVLGQALVHMTVSQCMKVGVPLPDPNIVKKRRRHGLACGVKAGGDQASAHDPPGEVILLAVFLCDGRRGLKPGVPVPGGSFNRSRRVRDITVEPEPGGDIE